MISNSADGKTWGVTISANTVGRKRTAIALVLDRSSIMSENRGDGESKYKSLQEACTIFMDTMLEGDGVAIVRFNGKADLLQGVTKLGSPLNPSHMARSKAKAILTGPQLDPSGDASIGNGIYEGHKALDAGGPDYDVKTLLVVTGRQRESVNAG